MTWPTSKTKSGDPRRHSMGQPIRPHAAVIERTNRLIEEVRQRIADHVVPAGPALLRTQVLAIPDAIRAHDRLALKSTLTDVAVTALVWAACV